MEVMQSSWKSLAAEVAAGVVELSRGGAAGAFLGLLSITTTAGSRPLPW